MGLDASDNIDRRKLTPEQVGALEQYNFSKQQTQALTDLADMVQLITTHLNDQKNEGSQTTQSFGALLTDMRESLAALKDKQAPEPPDYAKPVVDAVSQLENRLTAALKAIDVKPNVTVDAPHVNVSPSTVDLRGVEKAMQSLPKAFKDAISLIPKTEIPKDDYTPLLEAWRGISEQLLSIENATRMKPLPGSIQAQGYGLSTAGTWGKAPLPLLDVAWDSFVGSNADANGYNQTLTFKNGVTTVRTLTLTYDASGNVTSIVRS